MPIQVSDIPFSWVRKELQLDETFAVGRRGHDVERIQEWLTFNSFAVVVDGQFGPATKFAVECFQKDSGLPTTGQVDTATFAALTKPLLDVLTRTEPLAPTLGEQAALVARRHLEAQPREIGGANCGPWVRVYMKGHDGEDFLWCAGFACFVVRQAAWELGVAMPIAYTFSCDLLATEAGDDFVSERDIRFERVALRDLPVGSLFVQRRSSSDWNHTGVVIATGPDLIETIEGNTNDGGSREGYEVCRRIRGIKSKDFVRIP